MANSLTSNPWVIDTAGAGVLFAGNIRVLQFGFSGYVLDTDTVTVKDRNGKVVWTGNGASDLSEVRSGNVGWIEGLIVDSLTSGTLQVYLG